MSETQDLSIATAEHLYNRVSGLEEDVRKIASGQAVLENEVRTIASGQRDLMDSFRQLHASLGQLNKPNYSNWIAACALIIVIIGGLSGMFIMPANQSIRYLVEDLKVIQNDLKEHAKGEGHAIAMKKLVAYNGMIETLVEKIEKNEEGLVDLDTVLQRELNLSDDVIRQELKALDTTLQREMDQKDEILETEIKGMNQRFGQLEKDRDKIQLWQGDHDNRVRGLNASQWTWIKHNDRQIQELKSKVFGTGKSNLPSVPGAARGEE
jgi:hypothetical protein